MLTPSQTPAKKFSFYLSSVFNQLQSQDVYKMN